MIAVAGAGMVAGAIVVSYGLPAIILGVLWPTIEVGRFTVLNYRGVLVAPALWIVFPLWALGVVALRMSLYFYPVDVTGVLEPSGVFRGLQAILPLSSMVTVALGALVFGVIDDVWGGKDAKGFRGHVGSLFRGQLTTGGLKLLGIGLVSLLAAIYTALSEGLASGGVSGPSVFAIAVTAVLGTLLIALSANTVNLADLRPGRALKVGLVLLVFALLSTLVLCVRAHVPVVGTLLALVLVGVILAGPMLAVWPYDVSERGMLGDAGANALGALLGYVIFVGLAPAATQGVGPAIAILGVITGLLLLVNGLSERYSYSDLIERNAALRWFDRLGRPDFDEATGEPRPDDA